MLDAFCVDKQVLLDAFCVDKQVLLDEFCVDKQVLLDAFCVDKQVLLEAFCVDKKYCLVLCWTASIVKWVLCDKQDVSFVLISKYCYKCVLCW